MTAPKPMVERLLGRILLPDDRDAIVGDLIEVSRRKGADGQSGWYLKEVLCLLVYATTTRLTRFLMANENGHRPPRVALAVNLAALALFWLIGLVMVRGVGALAYGPLADTLALIAACGTGVAVAMKLRATLAAVLLGGMVAVQAATLTIQAAFGARLLQGPGVGWALIIAGTGGAFIGAVVSQYFFGASDTAGRRPATSFSSLP